MTQPNTQNTLPDKLRVLLIIDVAQMLRLAEFTVRQMAKDGALGFRKVGRTWITTQGAVEAYLTSLTQGKA